MSVVAGEIVTGAEVAGAEVAGSAGASSTDYPLGALNDEFNTSSLDSHWSLYEPVDARVEQSVADDELNLTCNLGGVGYSFWYNANQGILVYKLVTGDFDVSAGVRVRNYDDDGLPTVSDTHYRIAGLAAHDPDRSVNLDYVHVGLGTTGGAVIAAEWKDTQASVSFFADYADSDTETGVGEIRLQRVGQVYNFYYRAGPADAWILLQTRGRGAAPLPDTLQVGFMVYSDEGTLPGGDIRLFADWVRFTP